MLLYRNGFRGVLISYRERSLQDAIFMYPFIWYILIYSYIYFLRERERGGWGKRKEDRNEEKWVKQTKWIDI